MSVCLTRTDIRSIAPGGMIFTVQIAGLVTTTAGSIIAVPPQALAVVRRTCPPTEGPLEHDSGPVLPNVPSSAATAA